ncbi:MAG: hypothetical protein ACPIOQ_60085, partial [Promethearchaeia archaeon]
LGKGFQVQNTRRIPPSCIGKVIFDDEEPFASLATPLFSCRSAAWEQHGPTESKRNTPRQRGGHRALCSAGTGCSRGAVQGEVSASDALFGAC